MLALGFQISNRLKSSLSVKRAQHPELPTENKQHFEILKHLGFSQGSHYHENSDPANRSLSTTQLPLSTHY